MTTEYERRWTAAQAEMTSAGVWQSNATPPVILLLRRLGLRPRPPYYIGFWQLALVYGAFFSVFWGLLMWFLDWSARGMSVPAALLSSLVAGTLFGLILSTLTHRSRKRHGLRNWNDL
ncbi:DUF6404 family protein [Marinovum sp. 2_MG-2023]|uniref:DUF6404 family protein n=1 Tax=unclassified Marinovum TaxID=2647166 RepID=UPI0026E41A20|nr:MULTISPECIES: DUF6404 family protein [unclassified Marinovum]MDO6729431.1 DUF6404 family protein [Marinovum sp. 2_MG-2023]MDO6781333.1 DUF6404 family protein [Marinovum sp. 1_MG-2023]